MDKKRFKKNLHDTKLGRFGRPAEDGNKKKRPVTWMLFF